MKRMFGFTLLELLVTVAIVAITLLAGVPSLIDFIKSSRSSQQASYIASSLQMARLSAIDSGLVVTLCPTQNNLSSCTTSWDGPLMVFEDNDGDSSYDSGETVLKVIDAAPDTITRSFNNGSVVSYQPEGHTSDFGTFSVCADSKEAKYARSVVINLQGRIKLSRDYDGDGVHEYPEGTDLNCES
ncbi:GspH/FimT family pseudopilin [Neiella marina]|uniref:Type II secretion system protein H n=1 Tax=Neiella holothuriorum TaxID=2870530 RepID=A0ABS7EHQ8_9GAMM|nr:GspH/FimT family pseudopilin [Neiella holothuriorum]MBW8191886.1 GspH/FimT family pseudopilin [Neiella holothuriorum]